MSHINGVKWLLLLAVFTALECQSAPQIVDVSLAYNVDQREPSPPLNPPGTCSETEPANTPILNSKAHRNIFLWTKVSSSDESILKHSWMKRRRRIFRKKNYNIHNR